jgi:hypothetical protein
MLLRLSSEIIDNNSPKTSLHDLTVEWSFYNVMSVRDDMDTQRDTS